MHINGVCGCCSGCGGELKEVNGTFASPNYPGAVTASYTCVWTIQVPARRNVNLRLSVTPALSSSTGAGDAVTPGGRSCPTSYVKVVVSGRVGGQQTVTELGRFCTDVSTTD